ncbi:MAG: hypothetical protein AAF614_41405, partial [Chloroflexota bacterium]
MVWQKPFFSVECDKVFVIVISVSSQPLIQNRRNFMNRSLAWKIALAILVAQLFFALSPIVT